MSTNLRDAAWVAGAACVLALCALRPREGGPEPARRGEGLYSEAFEAADPGALYVPIRFWNAAVMPGPAGDAEDLPVGKFDLRRAERRLESAFALPPPPPAAVVPEAGAGQEAQPRSLFDAGGLISGDSLTRAGGLGWLADEVFAAERAEMRERQARRLSPAAELLREGLLRDSLLDETLRGGALQDGGNPYSLGPLSPADSGSYRLGGSRGETIRMERWELPEPRAWRE